MQIIELTPEQARRVWAPRRRRWNAALPQSSRQARLLFAESVWKHVTTVAGVDIAKHNFRIARNRPSSSGRNWGGFWVSITLGTDEKDIRSVIVHEVAHTVAFRKHRTLKHDQRFYKEFFALTKACGYDMQYAINREKGYKPRNSAKVARQYSRSK